MRLNELMDFGTGTKENSIVADVTPLFGDERYPTDLNGLYINNPDEINRHKSPYYGVSIPKPGRYVAQITITKKALENINNLPYADQISSSYKQLNMGTALWITLGTYNDPRDAAYCMQHVKFGGDYDEFIEQWMKETFLTKEKGITENWKAAEEGMPTWQYDPITIDQLIKTDKGTLEKQRIFLQNAQKYWLPKITQFMNNINTRNHLELDVTDIGFYANQIFRRLSTEDKKNKDLLVSSKFKDIVKQEIGL